MLILLTSQFVSGQQKITDTKKLEKVLRDHIEFLSDDKLEGRRTGSPGEKLAHTYISRQFEKAGLQKIGSGNYLQSFEVNDGRSLTADNQLLINNKPVQLHTNYFPLAYSGNGKVYLVKDDILLADTFKIASLLEENKTNPHFDLKAAIVERAISAEKKGKTALIIKDNSSVVPDNLKFDEKDKTPFLKIPVIYINDKNSADPQMANLGKGNIVVTVNISDKKRTGNNVIGFINNHASSTIILGAHYDHLGYGEDRNSLYSGNEKKIHNGADDNASGTAALLELASMLSKSQLKNNNYLFIAFSGEELGLYGSKFFVENIPSQVTNINYMINMDMIGRLNDSTRGLSVGGYGTSPLWNSLVTSNDPYLKIKLDSSGSGPSDHTSFYRKDIPVLFFFTGTHQDYHKPSDDADKINYAGEAQVIRYIYNIIELSDTKGKLSFTKTREAASMGKSSFKVSMGIMPDYTFSGNGVFVDGVTDGRAAQKAGIKRGDVILQLGEHKFSDVQTYMGALNKFNKGETTKVKVLRGKEELMFDIVF
ncbi:MAG: M20/M25/M40 family metallo-hydrolase [Ferruginibacter sp.]